MNKAMQNIVTGGAFMGTKAAKYPQGHKNMWIFP